MTALLNRIIDIPLLFLRLGCILTDHSQEHSPKFLNSEAFKINKMSDWLKHMAKPIRRFLRSGCILTDHFQEHSPKFLNSEAFKINIMSDWLNHMAKPIRSCVTFKFTKSWTK